MAFQGIQNVSFKGATRGNRMQEMKNLMIDEKVIELVTSLKVRKYMSDKDKGVTKEDGEAQRNRCNNLDQLGPKIFRSQGESKEKFHT